MKIYVFSKSITLEFDIESEEDFYVENKLFIIKFVEGDAKRAYSIRLDLVVLVFTYNIIEGKLVVENWYTQQELIETWENK
jgi:hypothetical protein